MKLILVAVLAILACSQGKEAGIRRYNGYKVYSVTANTPEQYKVLWDAYTNDEYELDFWTKPLLHGKTDVMVPPEEQTEFLKVLDDNQLEHEIKIDDVQSLIDEEKQENDKARSKLRSGPGSRAIGWDSYARYSEIETFIKELPALNRIASVETYGTSYEGRNLYAVKLSTNPNNRKAIVIDANIHAREWITSATATWILNELVTKTSEYASVLDDIDYYIIPMVNTDGYEYAHTSDRMWRKTRSVNAGSTCRGCDPNRNFPFKFGGEGTSSNPCSDIFKGPVALSESETKALADYINRLKDGGVNLQAYISFHSYGQLWLLPWGYTAGAYPPDYAQQLTLGEAVKSAIAAHSGTQYTTGTGADVLYGVGGASDDWAKSINIKYTVTAEMRDTGRYGFILPPNQIVANAEEMMVALKVVAERVRSEN